jgi:hypothetical protein
MAAMARLPYGAAPFEASRRRAAEVAAWLQTETRDAERAAARGAKADEVWYREAGSGALTVISSAVPAS